MAVNPDGPEVIEPRPKADRSIATLLSDLASETMLLVRQELALLKAELNEKFSRAGKGEMSRVLTSSAIAIIGLAFIAGAGALFLFGASLIDLIFG